MTPNDVIVLAIETAARKYPSAGGGKSWDDNFISTETAQLLARVVITELYAAGFKIERVT